MRYLVAGMYLAAAIVQFICLKFVYNIDKDMLVQMNKDLEARK